MKKGNEIMDVIKNDCPFDPDGKTITLSEDDLEKSILAATGSLTAAATLFTMALVNDSDESTVWYIRNCMFEKAISVIAEANRTNFDTVFQKIKECTGA